MQRIAGTEWQLSQRKKNAVKKVTGQKAGGAMLTARVPTSITRTGKTTAGKNPEMVSRAGKKRKYLKKHLKGVLEITSHRVRLKHQLYPYHKCLHKSPQPKGKGKP